MYPAIGYWFTQFNGSNRIDFILFTWWWKQSELPKSYISLTKKGTRIQKQVSVSRRLRETFRRSGNASWSLSPWCFARQCREKNILRALAASFTYDLQLRHWNTEISVHGGFNWLQRFTGTEWVSMYHANIE
jgi:hypothetical protein